MTAPDPPNDSPPRVPPPPRPPAPSEKDRALAALHNYAKPQPKANPAGEALEPEAPSNPASGASGFVNMLAKGQFGSGGPGDSRAGDSRAPASRKPGENPSAKSKYSLHMAREIPPSAPNPAGVPGGAKSQAAAALNTPREQEISRPPARRSKPPSPWYRVVLPVMVLVALVLLVIGLWAAGAMLYMANATPTEPSEVHYPLIQWSFTAGTGEHPGDFTPMSRLMALSMLATLPVALVLLVTAVLMWRRLTKRPR